MRPQWTRRELTLFGAGALVSTRLARAGSGPLLRPGRVGLAELATPPPGAHLERGAARAAIERALVAATGEPTPRKAVAALFSPSDTVGIKLNCLASPLSPRIELVEGLVAVLRDYGIAPGRIVVFERSDRELQRARELVRDSVERVTQAVHSASRGCPRFDNSFLPVHSSF